MYLKGLMTARRGCAAWALSGCLTIGGTAAIAQEGALVRSERSVTGRASVTSTVPESAWMGIAILVGIVAMNMRRRFKG